MNQTDIKVGDKYGLDELPENQMNKSGKLEWVSDDVLALAHDGKLYEFTMAVECECVMNVSEEDGSVEVLEGERQ